MESSWVIEPSPSQKKMLPGRRYSNTWRILGSTVFGVPVIMVWSATCSSNGRRLVPNRPRGPKAAAANRREFLDVWPGRFMIAGLTCPSLPEMNGLLTPDRNFLPTSSAFSSVSSTCTFHR